jgi:tetratricopeptide (TPR) repeat protein
MAKETLDSLRQKAQKALAQGQYQESCQFFQQALALGHDRAELHYGLATVYFLLGDLPHAAHHFKEVTRLDPLRAGAYINLGAVYNRLGQYEEAIATLRRGIQLDNNRGEGYYNLGLVYRQLGQLDLAIQAYREATRVNPRMADAHLNVGNIFFEKEQYGMAIAHYRQALEIRPNWEKAKSALENAQAQQAPTETAAKPDEPPPATKPARALDPNRIVDPNIHGTALRDVHQYVTEMDAQSRKLADILLQDVENSIKGLSNCLLFPDNPAYNLTDQLHKFDLVVGQLQKLQQSIQKRIQQVETLGEQLAQM